jgi:hypothetical protein
MTVFRATPITEAIAIWTMDKEHKVMLLIESGRFRIIHFLGNEEKGTTFIEINGGWELTISQKPQYSLITD